MAGDPAAGRYYLEHVAQGAHDYFQHRGESPGRWFGAGCEHWGLTGRVQDEAFLALVQQRDPAKLDQSIHDLSERIRRGAHLGRRFRSREGMQQVAGLDLTFRAPKSVSLLFSLGGAHGHQDVANAVRSAHDRAVEDALGYLATVAGHARRGQAGVSQVETEGLIHALFRHRTSRAGDPQLHTHAVTINRVLGKDGKWSALDGKAFYAQAKTAGTLTRRRCATTCGSSGSSGS